MIMFPRKSIMEDFFMKKFIVVMLMVMSFPSFAQESQKTDDLRFFQQDLMELRNVRNQSIELSVLQENCKWYNGHVGFEYDRRDHGRAGYFSALHKVSPKGKCIIDPCDFPRPPKPIHYPDTTPFPFQVDCCC
jgi:hypothetical protein